MESGENILFFFLFLFICSLFKILSEFMVELNLISN